MSAAPKPRVDASSSVVDWDGALVVAFAIRSRSRRENGSAVALRDRLLRIRGPDASAARAVADWLLPPATTQPSRPPGSGVSQKANRHPLETGS